MLQERSFDTGEVVLNYAEGAPSGPPVVLLHGITGRWQGVQTLIPMLDQQWHVYALDSRGAGRSGRVSGRYSLLDYAHDVGSFAAHLSEPAVLIGHSMGASIALVTAAEYPSATRAVVLIDPPLDVEYFARDRAEFFATLRGLRDFLQTSPSLETVATWRQTMLPQESQEMREFYADQLYRLDPDALDAFTEGQTYADYSLAERLRRVRCPLLLLYGDSVQGSVVRDEDAVFVRTHLPSATTAKVPGGSHMFFEEQPDLVKRHLDSFLSSA
jgi:pimeloyl-ACP methyl ester carboxylesterase